MQTGVVFCVANGTLVQIESQNHVGYYKDY